MAEDELYSLIVSQLLADGREEAAGLVQAALLPAGTVCKPSAELRGILDAAQHLRNAADLEAESMDVTGGATAGSEGLPELDLQAQTKELLVTAVPRYDLAHTDGFKYGCAAAVLCPNNRHAAAGFDDGSIRVYDMQKLFSPEGPVLKTFSQDSVLPINALAFHPNEGVLLSGCEDRTIKYFNFGKSVVKSYRTVQDAHPIRSLSVHPQGDYFLAGTDHPTVRLYDFRSARCFAGARSTDEHTAPVTVVRYAHSATMFASSSKAGDIKLWDGVSHSCGTTIQGAHGGAVVTSLQFSRNDKYLLSSGRDSCIRLWDVRMGTCAVEYAGVDHSGARISHACFDHTETIVLSQDTEKRSVLCWNARTGRLLGPLGKAQDAQIRCTAHAENGPNLMTASADQQVRFWYQTTVAS